MTKIVLSDHIKFHSEVSKKDIPEILTYFEESTFQKKEILLRTDEKCNKLFFVSRGCMHLYFIDKYGNKKTTQFAIENWWLTDFLAFRDEGNSNFDIEAIEKSEILTISFAKHKELLENFPKMEKYFRVIYQTAYGAALMRIRFIYTYSKEEIYFKFREDFPDFVNRVPQYLIAGFLGLSPEYLSEIKRKEF